MEVSMNADKVGLYDLGDAVARITETIDGKPVVTILSPAIDGLGPQEITLWPQTRNDARGLLSLARALTTWEFRVEDQQK